MSKAQEQQLLTRLDQLKIAKGILVANKRANKITKVDQEKLDQYIEEIMDLEEEIAKMKADKERIDTFPVAENEKHLVHAILLKGKRYDPETGAEINKPVLQKFSVKDFVNFSKNAPLLGFTVNVVWNPTQNG